MNNLKTTSVQTSPKSTNQHSKKYAMIRTDAESKWPAWKVSTYNINVAVSAHAKKVITK